MKNADVIRSMTDEQLYEFLSEWEQQDIDYAITFCDLCEQGKREGGKGNELGLDCDGCREHFLKVDAESHLGLNGWLRHNGFEPSIEPQQWIPCSERLPDTDISVLVSDGVYVWVDELQEDYEDGKNIYWWDSQCSFDFNDTAWMPLPTPYKGGDTE